MDIPAATGHTSQGTTAVPPTAPSETTTPLTATPTPTQGGVEPRGVVFMALAETFRQTLVELEGVSLTPCFLCPAELPYLRPSQIACPGGA